ncbi:hypothetical protein F4859DRAFT_144922 [Xylaria cf. heliscus]|nr:hypothetical protein F4859DRAFT_144922 [Xylaria cf. heliscus]
MAPSANTNESGGMIELRTTNSSSNIRSHSDNGGGVDFDDKIREAYDRGRAGMRGDGGRKDASSSPFAKAPRKDGLQRLPSRVDDDFEDRAESVATAEVFENPETAAAARGSGGSGGGGGEDGAGTVYYKVYRRRWFGLIQLTLLNIVVSWDNICIHKRTCASSFSSCSSSTSTKPTNVQYLPNQ